MIPIGLLYVSSKLVKAGIRVHILDTRINYVSWQESLSRLINDNTRVIGITVMSGRSITESINISRFIKSQWPKINIVWGGPHPTFSPDDVLQEQSVDFIVRGYGAEPFYQLVMHLCSSDKNINLQDIPGLSWRNSPEKYTHNPVENRFEFIDYKDIPYDLIHDLSHYRYLDSGEMVFPVYSAMGCPYRCIFCSSPTQYAKFDKKWQPYPVEDVVGHIEMLKNKYGATFIYFIDDDSFVDLSNVENIIDKIKSAGLKIKLGFRGARIDEVARMEDGFITKLAEAGTNTVHIGVESGSDRILKLVNKGITVKDILEVNRKLARHKEIKVFYNFIVGFPTETIEETKMTRDLIMKLVHDNSSCCVIPLNKPRPLPGSELYSLAIRFGYKKPATLKEWSNYDVEAENYNPVWLTKKHNRFIRMMFISMYFIDNKIFKFNLSNDLRNILLKIIVLIYTPIARLRFKYGIYHFFIEGRIYSILNKFLPEYS